jgi:hypothetical protein
MPGGTIRNLLATATWRPKFVQTWFESYFLFALDSLTITFHDVLLRSQV